MDSKIMYKRGNFYTGYPFGVEVEMFFGSRELHGPFTTENEANNYAHAIIQEQPYFGSVRSVKVVKIETPQAGVEIVWQEGGTLGKPGEFVYSKAGA
jgi:hypothetical protein